jgi:hypothetical protein
MSISVPQRAPLRLKDIADSHKTGEICLDALVSESTYEIQQLSNVLFSLPGFLAALDSASHYTPVDGCPLYTLSLSSSHFHRITLLGIPEGVRIPLHDHPEMVSIVLLLAGRIYSPRYQLVSGRNEHRLVELSRCTDHMHSTDDIIVMTPDSCNLHSLEAISTQAACLSIQISTQSRLNSQSFYFPAQHTSSDNTHRLWHRVQLREPYQSV